VLCTGNSCRSQMAHGYMQEYAGDKAEVASAGVEAHGLNPRTVKVMAEDGVDISHHTSDKVDKYSGQEFDFIITVCDNAKENCPYFPGEAMRLHQNFTDPADATGTEEEILDVYRHVREEVKNYCREFVDQYL
ncbi:MAG: arsenate reductase ArsC, partial [Bacteroidia bacterium]